MLSFAGQEQQQMLTTGQVTVGVLLSKNFFMSATSFTTIFIIFFLFFVVLSLYRKERNTYFRLLSSPIKPADIPPDPEGFEKDNYFVPSSASSGWAIAAGYAGPLAICPFFAPIALILGIIAIRHVKKHQLAGRGRAIFGIVMGGIFTLILLTFVLLAGIMLVRG
ncbi:MAG: DUF4190 domain-containing protein [Planctomycetaceae bacterium]|nr:DUF4190 domain-containing protein [Planctomycetaceae bacterium]